MKNPKFHMQGTEGTGLYVVLCASALGRVGFRNLPGGQTRVRIEPSSLEAGAQMRSCFPGYKEGTGGQEYRFSTVVPTKDLPAVLQNACRALSAGDGVEINPEALPEFRAVALAAFQPAAPQAEPVAPAQSEEQERQTLIARVRALKLPGANGASRWSLKTLRSKVQQQQ